MIDAAGREDLLTNAFDVHRAEFRMRQERALLGRGAALVCFGFGHDYLHGQRRLAAAAGRSGDFDTVEVWGPERFRREPIAEAYAHILTHARGAGYWLWKPYILAQAMAALRDGDFVLYSDTGHQAVDDDPLPPLAPLLTWLAGSERRVAIARLFGHPNAHWTKRDCFVLMGCDEARYWGADQLQSSYVGLMVSDTSRRLVDEWLRFVCDERVVTDLDNRMGLPNLDGFVEHRHDQSIITNLIYQHDLEIPAQRQYSKRVKDCIVEMEQDAAVAARPSENLALGKVWRASSPSVFSTASDVYRGPQGEQGLFFFHTEFEDRPWFTLDLGATLRVSELRIYNRWDRYFVRARTMRVSVSDDDRDYTVIFDAVAADWDPRTPLFLRPRRRPMRFVRIELTEPQYLHLSAIEVFGESD